VLRYNGMLIGVFELLAEARDQISSVTNAINAQQQFWLADAALAASVMGKPSDGRLDGRRRRRSLRCRRALTPSTN